MLGFNEWDNLSAYNSSQNSNKSYRFDIHHEEIIDEIIPPRYIPQTLDYYTKITSFNKQEVKEFYRNFKNECPYGYLTEDSFKAIYERVFPFGDASEYAHFMFRVFDTDQQGSVTFEKFLIGLSVLLKGTLRARLTWTFMLYDIHGMGAISKKEMLTIIKSLQKMLGNKNISEEICGRYVDTILAKFHTKTEGVVTLQEFCDSCEKDESIMQNLAVYSAI